MDGLRVAAEAAFSTTTSTPTWKISSTDSPRDKAPSFRRLLAERFVTDPSEGGGRLIGHPFFFRRFYMHAETVSSPMGSYTSHTDLRPVLLQDSPEESQGSTQPSS